MNKKHRWTKENRVRAQLIVAILLALLAYLLFLGFASPPGIVLSGLVGAVHGLWSWNKYQEAQWQRFNSSLSSRKNNE